jgi:hypothetical protein
VFRPDCDLPHRPLRSVVVNDQAAVFEDPHQRILLPHVIAEGGSEQAALVADLLVLDGGPFKEGLEVRTQMLVAQALDGFGRIAAPGLLESPPAASGQGGG